MGLDMYLLAKLEGDNEKHIKECCGGVIPFGLETDKKEIGYWRKAYDVCEMIMNKLRETREIKEDNCVDFLLSDDEIQYFINYSKEEVKNRKEVLKSENYENPRFWVAKAWDDTLRFFQEAKKLRDTNSTTNIYYSMWY